LSRGVTLGRAISWRTVASVFGVKYVGFGYLIVDYCRL
jgi:hypothetical protein